MTVTTNIRALVLLILLTPAARPADRYVQPVGNFRNKAQQTIAVLTDFYNSRNAFEVDVYLSEAIANPRMRLGGTDARGNSTPLGTSRFSPKSLEARLDALDLVGAYASKLGDLAGTEAPSSFKDAAGLLGTNVSALDKTFATLTDSTAAKYVTPVAALLGAIGKMVLEHKRDRMITDAVNEGSPQVEAILNLVKDDLKTIFAPLAETGSAAELADLIALYNRTAPELAFNDRKALLESIRNAAVAHASVASSVPVNLVSAMLTAEKALAAVASSSKKPKSSDFAGVNDAMNNWSAQISTAAPQAKSLLQILQ